MTRELIVKALYGGLWHTTHPDRFQNILKGGAILPEPDIPDGERWKTSRGREHYPFVRTLGGVSLFDFNQFDPDRYSEKYPMSSWSNFVPYRIDWGQAVWIEIARDPIASKLISGSELVDRWKRDNAWGHTIMPVIECACIGPVPRAVFKQAFLVRQDDNEFHPLAL